MSQAEQVGVGVPAWRDGRALGGAAGVLRSAACVLGTDRRQAAQHRAERPLMHQGRSRGGAHREELPQNHAKAAGVGVGLRVGWGSWRQGQQCLGGAPPRRKHADEQALSYAVSLLRRSPVD